jgi:hypothetical protein
MSPWMRSACRIVRWCWIWLHRRVVNLGCGRRGDGDGVGVLVSLPPLALLALLGGRVCSWQVPPRSTAIAPACHRGPPSRIQNGHPRRPVGPGSLDVARTVSSPSRISLFAQTADGRARRQSHTAGGCLAASGGLWRCRVAHDPWSRNCQREALRNQGTCPTRRRSRNRWR